MEVRVQVRSTVAASVREVMLGAGIVPEFVSSRVDLARTGFFTAFRMTEGDLLCVGRLGLTVAIELSGSFLSS